MAVRTVLQLQLSDVEDFLRAPYDVYTATLPKVLWRRHARCAGPQDSACRLHSVHGDLMRGQHARRRACQLRTLSTSRTGGCCRLEHLSVHTVVAECEAVLDRRGDTDAAGRRYSEWVSSPEGLAAVRAAIGDFRSHLLSRGAPACHCCVLAQSSVMCEN